MAKEKETAVKDQPKTNGVATTQTTNVAIAEKTVSREDARKMLMDAEVGELDSGYLNFQPGDKKRVCFIGRKEIPGLDSNNPDKKTNAVVFLTDSGKEQINADAVIISYFDRQPIGCIRQITCKGEQRSDKGSYKTFEFHELKLKA